MNSAKAANFCHTLSHKINDTDVTSSWMSLVTPVFVGTELSGEEESVLIGKTYQDALNAVNGDASKILQMLWTSKLALPQQLARAEDDALKPILDKMADENYQTVFNIDACAQYATAANLPLLMAEYPMMRSGKLLKALLTKCVTFTPIFARSPAILPRVLSSVTTNPAAQLPNSSSWKANTFTTFSNDETAYLL